MLLSLVPDFLAQRQSEILAIQEADVRLKSLMTAQRSMNCQITAFEALHREVSTRQSFDLATLHQRQTSIEKDHSTIFTALSDIRRDLTELRAARDFTELALEVQSVHSALKDVTKLTAEVSALRVCSEESQNQLKAHDTKLDLLNKVETNISEIKVDLEQLKTQFTVIKEVTLRFDSRIVPSFPPLFEAFQTKRFKLLWRGSRDGFRATEFHRRCDGHANTLTLMLDTTGNIFGGFTPVKWESPSKVTLKSDGSLQSFIFTLKNPHSLPARKFALKPECKGKAIRCDSSRGPEYGVGCLSVLDNCNINTKSYSSCLGDEYINDTGLNGNVVLAGTAPFMVKEIEVFEIED
jgi:hypothetical protein